jgi:hypothetical protein
MRINSVTARLVEGTLAALLPCAAQATTIFCPELEEPALRARLQSAYTEADLVALVDPQPAAIYLNDDEELYELRVRSVWKGDVGPTIYVNDIPGLLLFATRNGASGPFESLGPCTAPFVDAAVLDELFGGSRLPSDDIRETRFTPLEKLAFVAAAGVGVAVLVGFVWVLSYVFASHNKRMQRSRDR